MVDTIQLHHDMLRIAILMPQFIIFNTIHFTEATNNNFREKNSLLRFKHYFALVTSKNVPNR